MGAFNIIGLSTTEFSIASATAEISTIAGVFGLAIIFFVLLIIGGFIIYKMLTDRNERKENDEDRTIGDNKGVAKSKRDD